MKFLIDEQPPPALARWLVDAGHEAQHVGAKGLARASDDEIWKEALRTGAVIVSKDYDFAHRRALAEDGPQILWVRLGNSRTPALLQAFSVALARIVEALARGENLVELV